MAEGSNKQILVSMANGDVYYMGAGDFRTLMGLLERIDDGHFRFVDAKSGSTIIIKVSAISSIVKREATNG